MTNRIPEYTVSLIDLEDFSAIFSDEVLKTDSDYASNALKQLKEKNTNSGLGWSKFVEKSVPFENCHYCICTDSIRK